MKGVVFVLFWIFWCFTTCEALDSNGFGEYLNKMQDRKSNLREMIPHAELFHVMGDVHVLMRAGAIYHSKKSELDLFGNPLFHNSKLVPRYNIFNSDFDRSIKDVHIDGNNVLIRSTNARSLLRLKIKQGHIFSTAMDFTQEGDEEHKGSRDFLITLEPKWIAGDIILLENVLEVSFEELWEEAYIHTEMQHYQYRQPNGSSVYRPVPVSYKLIDTIEVDYPSSSTNSKTTITEKGIFDSVLDLGAKLVRPFVAAYEFGKAVIEFIDFLLDIGAQEGDSVFSFNYNPLSKSRQAEILLYEKKFEKTLAEGSSASGPTNVNSTASIELSISVKVVCKDCWGKATFRTSTRYEYSTDKELNVIARIDVDVDLKAKILFEAAVAVSFEAKVPLLAPDPTPKVSSMAVSGKTSNIKFNAGVFLKLKAGIELKGSITVDSSLSLKGYIEGKTGSGFGGVEFSSDLSITDSEFDVEFDAALTITADASVGPDISLEVYKFKFASFAGVALETEFAFKNSCKYKFSGEKAQIRSYANLGVTIPTEVKTILKFLGINLGKTKKEWDFFTYPIKFLQGCLGEKDPKSDKGIGTIPVEACSAAYRGHIYDFTSLILSSDEQYSITDGGFTYTFNICDKVSNSVCNSDSVGVCQSTDTSNSVAGKSTTEIKTIDRETFVLTYRNGDITGCQQGRTTDIYITCDKNANTPIIVSASEESQCKYRINMRSVKACYVPCEVYVGDTKFDLSPLIKPDGQSYSIAHKGGTLDVNICEPLTKPGCEGSGLCYTNSEGSISNVGNIVDYVSADKFNGFALYYPFSSSCGSKTSSINLNCNRDATTPYISSVYEDTGSFFCFVSTYTVTIESSLVCPEHCQFISGSELYDFTSLIKEGEGHYNIAKGSYGYDFNICAPLLGSQCSDPGVCQFSDDDDDRQFNLGYIISDPFRVYNSDDADSYAFRYTGGDYCSSGVQRRTDVILECDESASEPVVDSLDEPSECLYEIKMKTDRACESKAVAYHTTTKDIDSVYQIESGVWELLPQSSTGIYTIRFDVSKITTSSSDEWFSILIYGSELELISLSSDGYDDILTHYADYYVFEDYFDYLLFEDFAYADVVTDLINEMEYLDLVFSAANSPEIFSYIFIDAIIESHGTISSPRVPENILFSSFLSAPTPRFYYYCSASSGDPEIYVTTYEGDTIADGVSLGTTDFNFVENPDSDSDTILFFDVYSGGDSVLIDLLCIFHPIILGSQFIPRNPGLSDVLYRIPVDPEVNELFVKSARSDSLLDFYFIISGSDIIEEEPTLSSIGEISVYPQQMNRTDLAYVLVHGECADLQIKAIKDVTRDEPVTNRIRVNEAREVLDIPFTYRYPLSPDFVEDSFIHLDIISQYMERINATLSNGSSYNCSNAENGFCAIEFPAFEFTDDVAEFTVIVQDPFESTVFDIMITLTEVVHVDDFDTIEGFGDIEDIEYLFTVPESFQSFGILFQTEAESDNFKLSAYNRRTNEAFAANQLIPSFGLSAIPGDIFELQVAASSGPYTFELSPMDAPNVYMTSDDPSLLAFERGTFQLTIHIDSPGFFATNHNITSAASIMAFAYADELLWDDVVIDIYNGTLEDKFSYIPYGNEISVSTSTVFTKQLDNEHEQLCISFVPPHSSVIPFVDILISPFCFTCPRNSCGIHCGDCGAGESCINNFCRQGAAAPIADDPPVVYVPVPTPVPTPVYTVVYIEREDNSYSELSSSTSNSSVGQSSYVISLPVLFSCIFFML